MSASTMITLPRQRPVWVSVLLALLVFTGGIVIGAAGTVLVVVHDVRHVIRHPEEIPARLTARLNHRLSLDSAQSAGVEQILTQHVARIQQLRAAIHPEIQTQLTETHDEVRKLLKPDQQSKWDDLFEDFVNNWFPPSSKAIGE